MVATADGGFAPVSSRWMLCLVGPAEADDECIAEQTEGGWTELGRGASQTSCEMGVSRLMYCEGDVAVFQRRGTTSSRLQRGPAKTRQAEGGCSAQNTRRRTKNGPASEGGRSAQVGTLASRASHTRALHGRDADICDGVARCGQERDGRAAKWEAHRPSCPPASPPAIEPANPACDQTEQGERAKE
jgi:hypothetical protein